MNRPGTRFVAAVAATLLALGAALVLAASDADAGVDKRAFDPKKKAYGRTFKQWVVEWQEWYCSIPASVHPMLDETGQFVEVAQRGPVWFLGGVANASGIAERTATIPTGKALFFPVIDATYDNEGVVPPITTAEMAAFIAGQVGSVDVSEMQVVLDDAPIQGVSRMRVKAGPYRFAMPGANLAEVMTGGAQYHRGVYSPAMIDGYWVMLKPLAAGQHTLHFEAAFTQPQRFALDITYHLTAVDHDKP